MSAGAPLKRAILRELGEHPRSASWLAQALGHQPALMRAAISELYFGQRPDGKGDPADPKLACDPLGRFALRASVHLFAGYWVASDGAERGGRGSKRVLAATHPAVATEPPPECAQGLLNGDPA